MAKSNPRLLRVTTVPVSLKILLRGQLNFMMENGFEVLAVSSPGEEAESVKQSGVPFAPVPMTRKITPLADVVSLFRMLILIRRFKPDIVHSHTPKAGLIAMLASWLCRVPVRLHTIAGLPVTEARGLKRRLLLLTERLTSAAATRVYFNSPALRRILEDEIGANPKWKTLGRGSTNGIDMNFFSPTPELQQQAAQLRSNIAPGGEVIFCFVGRIVGDKGINELVAAFDRLATTVRAKLLLVGQYEPMLNPLLLQTTQLIETSKDIFSTGYQEDVRPAILCADVLVLPSYREGFPNVVLQACSLNRPCIVSNINGCNEIIEHGVNGLIVEPRDIEGLHMAMTELATDPQRRMTLGTNGRSMIGEHYRQSYIWSLILNEYRLQLAAIPGR